MIERERARLGCRWILEAVYRKKFAEHGENASRPFSRVRTYTRCFTLDDVLSSLVVGEGEKEKEEREAPKRVRIVDTSFARSRQQPAGSDNPPQKIYLSFVYRRSIEIVRLVRATLDE